MIGKIGAQMAMSCQNLANRLGASSAQGGAGGSQMAAVPGERAAPGGVDIDNMDRFAAQLAGAPRFLHLPEALSGQARASTAWSDLAASWQRLGTDPYVAGEGRYRTFSTLTQPSPSAPLSLDAHHPLYQPVAVNAVNGGVERNFRPVAAEVLANSLFLEVLHEGLRLANGAEALAGRATRWHVEVQQFRVEAQRAQSGQPTPEGIHRDGRDYVAMMLMERGHAEGATSTLWREGRQRLCELTLTTPSELLMVADRHLEHSVSPLRPAANAELGRRDMLIISYVNLAHPDPLTALLWPPPFRPQPDPSPPRSPTAL